MAWRLARSLESLRIQVNTIAPNRSKASDGTIGDPAHAARLSDHNPDSGGVVRAFDITDDPRGGLDALWLREALRNSGDQRIKYLISEGQICNSRRVGSTAAWEWRPYTGANGHFKHLHISVQPGSLGDTPGTFSLTRTGGSVVRPPITDLPEDDEMTPEQVALLQYVSTQVKAVAGEVGYVQAQAKAVAELVVAQAAATNARIDYVQKQARAIAQLVVDTGGADAARARELLERINTLPAGVVDADALAQQVATQLTITTKEN